MSNMREDSKNSWNSLSSVDHINCGSLQRIADAMELMAKNYAGLVDERDLYKRWYEEERDLVARRYRQIAALRGVITKLKARQALVET